MGEVFLYGVFAKYFPEGCTDLVQCTERFLVFSIERLFAFMSSTICHHHRSCTRTKNHIQPGCNSLAMWGIRCCSIHALSHSIPLWASGRPGDLACMCTRASFVRLMCPTQGPPFSTFIPNSHEPLQRRDARCKEDLSWRCAV